MQDSTRLATPRLHARRVADSFGEIGVPAEALWGAQTARSLRYFSIGNQRMPIEMVRAIALVKWAAAGVNADLGLIDPYQGAAIEDAARRVAEGEFDHQFPLSVWQTGSGTQTHMNVNEVIANWRRQRWRVRRHPTAASTPMHM
jgi:fumarate hydratase, class II